MLEIGGGGVRKVRVKGVGGEGIYFVNWAQETSYQLQVGPEPGGEGEGEEREPRGEGEGEEREPGGFY